MVSALQKMAWRDLWWLRGQVLATALVVMCGVASFVATYGTWQALQYAQQSFYQQHRFADVFASVKSAPIALREKLSQIDGIAQVDTRISSFGLLLTSKNNALVSVQILSLPAQPPRLNGVQLIRGRWPRSDRNNEVVVSETFARANGWLLGENLSLVVAGKQLDVRVVATALAPEFIYEIGPGALLPDPKRFGVMWLPEQRLMAMTQMIGAFNDVLIRLQHNASAPAVINALDRQLENYGGAGAYARADHASHQFIRDEIAQNRVHTAVVPGIFLAVAAFLLNAILSRLLVLQRGEIGLLRSMGYYRQQIASHYFQMSVLICMVGTVPGIVAGAWLGSELTVIYNDYYHFPQLRYRLQALDILLALSIAFFAALVAAIVPVRRVMLLSPVEAMQADRPRTFRHGFLERWLILWGRVAWWRMTIRQLLRHRVRSLLSFVAAVVATAILVLGGYGFDAMSAIMQQQFNELNREDVTLVLREPRDNRALHDMAHLPGVLLLDSFRQIPVELSHLNHRKRTMVTATEGRHQLRRNGHTLSSRANTQPGIVLERSLAERLHVHVGSYVTLNVLEGKRRSVVVPVANIVDEWLGMAAYISLDLAKVVLDDDGSINGAWLRIDHKYWPDLLHQLSQLPWLSASVKKSDVKQKMQDMLDRSMGFATFLNALFASAIAFGVIYNNLRIALSEGGRDLASLRVLGFSLAEVTRMLVTEQWLIIVAALPIGMIAGYGLCAWLSQLLVTDAYRLPLVVNASTFSNAVFVVFAAAAVSSVIVARRIRHMDLVTVLKTRE